jgi:hypothetical protein|tara:strand:- start:81 stop:308 length:228 start_codon:yes stop_codon:yes gene_type:complete
MSKKTASQSLRNSVKELDKINNVEFEFEGTLQEIIENPIEWAELQAERVIADNIENYLKSKELGEKFWDEIRNIS